MIALVVREIIVLILIGGFLAGILYWIWTVIKTK